MMFNLSSILYAQAEAAQQAPDSIWNQAFLFGMIFLIFYFLVIRPQNKKQRDLKDMIENLNKGDQVILTGGIYGTIHKIDQGHDHCQVEIADKCVVKVQKAQIALKVEKKPTQNKDEKSKDKKK